jgi:hypothetical protein
VKVKSFFALLGVVAIPVTIILVSGQNPLPWLLDQASSGRSMANPPVAWSVALDSPPSWAVGDSGTVVVGGGGYAAGLNASNGDRRWSWPVEYAGVAGTAGNSVVVVGGREPDRHLLDVLDPVSGAVRWQWPGTIGAWTFADMVLTLACPDPDLCTLSAHAPDSRPGESLWETPLPAGVRGLSGLNHALAGLRSLLTSGPVRAPRVLGLPVDNKVRLVDTRTGKVLRTMESDTGSRVFAAGDGALRIQAGYHNDGCRYLLTWTPLVGSAKAWSTDLFQPRTSDGAACEQRGDPAADNGRLYVIGPGRQDSVLDLTTGRAEYSTHDDEQVLAVGGFTAEKPTVVLVRSADHKSVSARSLASGAELWHHAIGKGTTVRTDGSVVAFVDASSGELTARRMVDGAQVVHASTLATLLGFTPDGLVLDEARSVGLLRYGSVHP